MTGAFRKTELPRELFHETKISELPELLPEPVLLHQPVLQVLLPEPVLLLLHQPVLPELLPS